MITEPSHQEVEQVIITLAAQSLEGKPVGTIAMFSDCCGVKKMGFRWMVKVFGWRAAIKSKLKDWKA